MSSEKLKIEIETLFKDTGIKELMDSTKKVQKQLSNSDFYKKYIAEKKKLDSGYFKTFEDYSKSATITEKIENDKKLKSYITYKDAQSRKDKDVLNSQEAMAKRLTLLVTAPLVGLGTMAVKSSIEIEKMTASFTTLLGSETKAKSMISTLNKMASITPFEPKPLVEATQKLLGFGIEAEKVQDVLSMLGDASQGSEQKLESLSLAYGKVATRGKSSMEELNMMIDAGVPIIAELANTLGVAEAEIFELSSKGKISFEDVNNAFISMTSQGGVFFNGMATASQTLGGKISTLKGNVNLLGASLGDELSPILKNVVDGLNKSILGFTEMSSTSKAMVVNLGGFTAIAPIIILSLTKIVNGIKAMTVAQMKLKLVKMANPYIAIGTAITGICIGLATWISKQNDLEGRLKDTEKVIDNMTQSSENFWNAWENESSDATTVTQKLINKEEYKKALNEMKTEFEKVADRIGGEIKEGSISKEISDINRKLFHLNRGNTLDAGYFNPFLDKEKEIKSLEEEKNKLYKEQDTIQKSLTKNAVIALEKGVSEKEVRSELLKITKHNKQVAESSLNNAIKLIAENEKLNKSKTKTVKVQKEEVVEKEKELDRFEQLKKSHQEYSEYMIKVNSNLLRDSDLMEQSKLSLLKLEHDEFQAYLNKEAEREKQRKKREEEAENAKKEIETQIDKYAILGNTIQSVSETISTSFLTAENTSYMSLGNIAQGLGNLSKGIADTASTVLSNFTSIQTAFKDAEKASEEFGEGSKQHVESLENAVTDTAVLVLQCVAVALTASAQIVKDVFSAMISDLDSEMSLLEEANQKEIDSINSKYDKELAELERFQQEKNNMLEYGYATEAEMLQAQYEEALEAYNNYKDTETESRREQLENYKESLKDKNSDEIGKALEAKERELKAVDEKKKLELLENVNSAKANKDKEALEREHTNNELELEYQRNLELAKLENSNLQSLHSLEVEQFNLKKASDIANIWISTAAGIATAWATSMQLGFPAGPIVAGVLTGALTTVSGVQTGLIASQSPPPQPQAISMPEPPAKYFKGGRIPGTDSQDKTLLFASSGERVLSQEQNKSFERLVDNLTNLNMNNNQNIVVKVYVDSSEIDIKKQIIELNKNEKWR